jgi:hypothetical protein
MRIPPLSHLRDPAMSRSIFLTKIPSSETTFHTLLHQPSQALLQKTMKILPMSFALQHQPNLRTMSHQLQLLGRLIIQTYSLQLHLIALGQLILHHDVTTAVVIAHLDLVRTAPGGLSVLPVLPVMWIMTIKRKMSGNSSPPKMGGICVIFASEFSLQIFR